MMTLAIAPIKNYRMPVCLFHFGIRWMGVGDTGAGRHSRFLRLDFIWEAWDWYKEGKDEYAG